MDWITTSGRSLDEAKSHALDQLGIVADEAEFDVINDVEKSVFGRVKTEAKIRTRVRPKQPATTDDRGSGRRRKGGQGRGKGNNRSDGNRSDKGRSNNKGSSNAGGGNGGNRQKNRNQKDGGGNNQKSGGNGRDGNSKSSNKGNTRDKSNNNNSNNNSNNNRNKKANAGRGGAAAAAVAGTAATKGKRDTVEHELMNREDQESAAEAFLVGVLGAFGMQGDVAVTEELADDDAIEMTVSGDELGLLVGQKGATVNALQELTRTVVQRKADGAKTNRLRVDVAGYRARRTAALQEFATKIAHDVLESGNEKLMEPMGPADRKVVHDTVNDIDGVDTGSEGEEPRRRVVIRPV